MHTLPVSRHAVCKREAPVSCSSNSMPLSVPSMPLLLASRPPPAAFVAARHPGAWRETLAAILTSAPYDQFESLLSALANRLAAAGECGRYACNFVGMCRFWRKPARPIPLPQRLALLPQVPV